MSIHIDALRDIAANHGWTVCDEAADEIEELEKAYELLFAENAKLRAEVERLTLLAFDPVAWLHRQGNHTEVSERPLEPGEIARGWTQEPLYLAAGAMVDARSCTCHPDDNPPKPCPRKLALSECRAAADVETSDVVERDPCDPSLLGKRIGYYPDGEPFGYITEQERADALAARGAKESLQ